MTDLIAITGATGHLGGGVARGLHERGRPLRLVVRDPSRAPDLAGAALAMASYDDPDALRRAFEGVDTLFLVSAAEAQDRLAQHRTAVRAAAEAGVRRVVYTSFLGAAPDAAFTLARDHFHTEQALTDAGLAHVALRNSLYADVVPAFVTDGVLRGPGGAGHLAPVARRDVVDVSVAALEDPTLTGPLALTGPVLHDLAEIAAVTGEVTGDATRYVAETVRRPTRRGAGTARPTGSSTHGSAPTSRSPPASWTWSPTRSNG